MVLDSKQTTVAYRCPHCGMGVMSAVNLFALSADMVKLKCTCGKSEMTVVMSKTDSKVRMTVPCLVCPVKLSHAEVTETANRVSAKFRKVIDLILTVI